MAVVGDVVRDDDRRQRPRLLERDPPLLRSAAAPSGCRAAPAARPSARGRSTAATSCLRLRRLEVADERQRRVLRHVVGRVEIAHVVDRRRLEVLHAADRRVLVGMRRERLVVDDLVQPAVRLVVDPHPPLFLHDLALVGERVASSMRSVAIRSASSHSASGRYCAGTVSQNTVSSSVV